MNIAKVKYTDEKVRIEYTIDRTNGGEPGKQYISNNPWVTV